MQKKIDYDSQLRNYLDFGIDVEVEDTLVNEDNFYLLNNKVEETDCYMKEFESNEKGEIKKIHYRKIKE